MFNIFSKDPNSFWGRPARLVPSSTSNAHTSYGQFMYVTPITLLVLSVAFGIYEYFNPGPDGNGPILQLVEIVALIWIAATVVLDLFFFILAAVDAYVSRRKQS